MRDNLALIGASWPGWFNATRLLKIWLLIVTLFGSTILAGCVQLNDPETTQDFQNQVIGTATQENIIGQTFQSRRPAAHNLQVFLIAVDGYPQEAFVVVELFSTPEDKQPLAKFSYPLRVLTGSAVSVPLDTIQGLPDNRFYLTIKTTGGAVEILGRNEDAYPRGTASINGKPISADLAFRLSYSYDLSAFLDDGANWISKAWLVLPLAVLLLLPGWLLLSATGLHRDYDWGGRVAISVGLSLAIISVVLLWTSALHLHWSLVGIYLVTGLLVIFFIFQQMHSWRAPRENKTGEPRTREWKVPVALFAIFLVSLAVRLIMVRDLATPPWVDPIHHAAIARLIIENGAYPDTYKPLINLGTSSYHAGFHANLAAFLQLANLGLAPGMLLYGQMLNALAVFAVYLFTVTLVKNRTAALLAALFAGLFTPMPAYYTSWGRYTQLAGLLIMPAAYAFTIRILLRPGGLIQVFHFRKSNNHRHWLSKPAIRNFVMAAIACSGLFLVHYRVLAFLGSLILAWLIVNTLSRRKLPGTIPVIGHQVVALAMETAAIFAITIPWWPGAYNTLLAPAVNQPHSPIPWFSDFSWSYLNNGAGIYILALAGLGLLWSLIQHRRFPYVLVIWTIMLYAMANLGAFFPPLGGLINNTSVTIALFFPVTALAGYLVGWVYDGWKHFIPQRWRLFYVSGFLVVIAAASIFAGRALLTIINPATILSRQADLAAADWIDANLPEDATIAVNPFLWGYGLYAGSDGCYWITPLTGRRTIPPPVLYGLEYKSAASQEIRQMGRQMLEESGEPAKLSQTLRAAGVNYICLGKRPGAISPALLESSPYFQPVYEKDGVHIFELIPPK